MKEIQESFDNISKFIFDNIKNEAQVRKAEIMLAKLKCYCFDFIDPEEESNEV